MTAAPFLPYGRQSIDDDDIAAVAAVLRSDWLTTGPAVEKFEASLAAAVDAPHAIVCNSGTAALHLAALAIGLGPGDVVLVPSITFMASANAARYVGADVEFVDVDWATGLSLPHHFEAAFARARKGRVRAAIPVHYAGQCAAPEEMAKIAAARDFTVIEDACHALGTRYGVGNETNFVGSARHSAMCAFSFHPVKTIAMGEGGAITTRDGALAERLRRYRSHGIERRAENFEDRAAALAADGSVNPWYHELPDPGFNYRASDINCALATSQLSKLARYAAERRRLGELYERLLAPLAPLIRPLARVSACDPVWHLYVARIDFPALGIDRAAAMTALKKAGVGTQVHYVPVHRQPYYRRLYGQIELPGADAFYDSCLTLPLFVGMNDGDVERVVAALAGLVRQAGRG
ncbi:MAG: UDP-4-amino-4,6-dideoxy-N-acetyl-beta-L-altrosamine transaminase [Alphaproteobacteria bacterium]|nr:UDP-4-amino-4,6-dideoxy-N-acetyl-beta-L-altrosamine transaminase [Alphaproteobacteria bacterium]